MVEFFFKYWIVFLLLAVWICFATVVQIRARRKKEKQEEKDAQKGPQK